MTKRPSLGSRPARPAVAVEPRRAKPPAPPPPPPATARSPSRGGKVQLGGYFDPLVKRQIDVFAAMEGRTIQSIMEEMYNLFAAKHGLHRLADAAE